jgi:lipopolysaccharide transport protein LptA
MIIVYNFSAFSSEKLNIKSDHLTIKKNDLSATFEGSVVLTFNGLKLYSSKLKIFYGDASTKRDIKEIIIPHKLKAVRNCGQEILFADSGHFDNSTKKLTLTGNVRMLKEGNVLVTNKLIYSAQFQSISQKDNAK